jgi:transmembrane sensor
MRNYSKYNLEDFLDDHDFHDWVHSNSELEGTRWEMLLKEYPQKRNELFQAKSIILNWKVATSTLSEVERVADIKRILSEIDVRSSAQVSTSFFRYHSWKVAAAAAIFLLIGWAVWQQRSPANSYSYELLVKNASSPLREISNNSQVPMQIDLPDESEVTLSPGGKLSYPERFTFDSTRTVILKGEAFFKVTRDVFHPFLVLSDGITTRVLGTSFRVRSGNNQVSVEVTSGQVEVYRMDQDVKRRDNLLLSANHQAVFSAEDNILKKGLVENPTVVTSNEEANNFQFDETPLANIFDLLHKSYGIKIIYDKEAVQGCNLTIPLNKEPFFTKLDIICNTINAKYEVFDDKVVITGGGSCN